MKFQTKCRRNESEYKILRKIAQKYLAIPYSSIESERKFKMAANLKTKERNRFSQEHLKMQAMIKENLFLIN